MYEIFNGLEMHIATKLVDTTRQSAIGMVVIVAKVRANLMLTYAVVVTVMIARNAAQRLFPKRPNPLLVIMDLVSKSEMIPLFRLSFPFGR
jgi:hypothetical protein